MKNFKLIRIAAAAGVALSLAAPAMAAEEDGVTCRAGTTAEQNSNNTNLKCSKPERVTRLSNCLTLGNGVNGLQQVVRTGPDMCTDPSSSANAGAPTPVLLPGDPTTGWVREDTPGGRDVFVQTIKKYEFPQGAIFNPLDNASKGVSCPSGYPDGGSLNGGRSIRCETARRVDADCDFSFTLRVDDNGRNKDACIGLTGVGNTKPKGITNVEYQTQLGSWKPVVQDGPDKFRHFGFPTSRN
ncbi:MAG: hypothetical protein Q7T07_13395 [Burkholderiaceae bacterium]|nr:hypothetical protein [Burkholderiaceae bacterium]